ncbi:unnamed protein product [Rhizoctonia solani]|uniref:Uncharacterized protein n=1 Tax=Rhizoctonia solani TaxID=456999 RepID=A0A8H3BVA7_9AGAM|nr:unnamed protein product [Rhizoctonia solani]
MTAITDSSNVAPACCSYEISTVPYRLRRLQAPRRNDTGWFGNGLTMQKPADLPSASCLHGLALPLSTCYTRPIAFLALRLVHTGTTPPFDHPIAYKPDWPRSRPALHKRGGTHRRVSANRQIRGWVASQSNRSHQPQPEPRTNRSAHPIGQ